MRKINRVVSEPVRFVGQPRTGRNPARVRHIGGPGGERRTFADLPAIFGPSVRQQAGPTRSTPGRQWDAAGDG